jgi:serine/threonine protein kinase
MEEHNHREVFRYYISMHLVFEYMNTDLCKLMESATFLTVPQAASICHQIVSAVEYMHTANVIHRDIKPENILVSIRNDGKMAGDVFILNGKSDITVKVADFGLARVIAAEDILLKNRAGIFM